MALAIGCVMGFGMPTVTHPAAGPAGTTGMPSPANAWGAGVSTSEVSQSSAARQAAPTTTSAPPDSDATHGVMELVSELVSARDAAIMAGDGAAIIALTAPDGPERARAQAFASELTDAPVVDIDTEVVAAQANSDGRVEVWTRQRRLRYADGRAFGVAQPRCAVWQLDAGQLVDVSPCE
ncbi:hypothetical protein [Neoactinobaculum massilliense]|uniref:hypothetical protein n=1 Tax=Neoactinobaculum massilliense TaxID=2364794 RepID=UPI000F52C51F|nr:hypothetical protein [Neoactinobaculum massilliense]